MYINNVKGQLSYLRKVAKTNGLTFKTVNVKYNDNQAYALFNRAAGERVSSDDTLHGWYDKELYTSIISEYKVN